MAASERPGSAATGVIVAGGASTRFEDGEKPIATLHGRPLITRVVTAVRSATDRPPVVAVRTAAQQTAYEAVVNNASFVRDDPAFAGPVAGIYGALAAVTTPWIFVCGADMPRLSPHAITWLGRQSGPANAIAPIHPDGTPEPLHAFYRTTPTRAAREILAPTSSAHSLLDALQPVEYIPLSQFPASTDIAASIKDVNTRADLTALQDAANDT